MATNSRVRLRINGIIHAKNTAGDYCSLSTSGSGVWTTFNASIVGRTSSGSTANAMIVLNGNSTNELTISPLSEGYDYFIPDLTIYAK